ncbi:MAG: hypothetical protein ACYCQJ_12115 [Nitrososphaerales archaeon]
MSSRIPVFGIYAFSTMAGGAFLSHRNTKELGWKRPGERLTTIATSSLISPFIFPPVVVIGTIAFGLDGLFRH